ncbi:amino acid abc transporter permease [Leptolyngbya sp. Heron Island J]|uniref:ABC transporter permease subunit n=1 Tax=Leptolyngbya sp. Heron Island J TaxID=1385935 RepID=UPI0003B98822|nr:ABC transporter permease subunit [Leptolyngbya sp. Heron Island J]ESA32605.1 amino acid abc transporter permease [Leptolyngbya sp. Heron Island J]
MTTTSPQSPLVVEESSPPPIAQAGPVAWLRKHLFNTWYNALLTVVLGSILLAAVWGMLNWAFRLAEWAVVPNNLALFMSGLYPSERYYRIWTILGVNVAMGGITWGLLVRNQATLFGRNVLITVAALCAGAIIFPLTRASSPVLIGLLALVLACAWVGKLLGKRQLQLSQFLSAGWFLVYAISLLILAGGDLRNSLIFLVAALALSIWLASVVLKLLANFSVVDTVSHNFFGIWLMRVLWFAGSIALFLPIFGFLNIPLFLKVFTYIVYIAFVSLLVPILAERRTLTTFVLVAVAFGLTFFVLTVIPDTVGGFFGLPPIGTNNWGGLTLTLFLAITGIALCFPIGVLMALGRRSNLPIIKGLSVAYIELIRGVPLISILFMGQVMIPLFLPEGVRPDNIVRAIVGLTLFSSAYLAENVRAGLQAIPRGQFEAAASLGLNNPLTLALIVLPQALKTAIPAIVGQFISLFQDTTLLGIVGLVELLGISNSILANPNYLGDYAEAYLFIALLYWFFCYAMSLGSRRIEQALNTER